MHRKTISRIKNYICCEDISLIENYVQAINDKENIWVCHHKLEIELNKSRKELKEMGLYYNRPANELIFLTSSEHSKLHQKGNTYCEGRILTEETKAKISKAHKGKKLTEETKQKISQTLKNKGIKLPSRKGCKLTEETKQKLSEARKLYWLRRKAKTSNALF